MTTTMSPSIKEIKDEIDINRVEIKILYGSQTGYAQDVAERLARTLWRYHFNVSLVTSLDEYERTNLNHESMVIFICSTTGDGEEPDNMKSFWKFILRKNLPCDVLKSLKYAVFGLGDSSYTKFNFPAKKLFRRLSQLGAQAICPRGDGDDQHYLGLDGAFIPWQEQLIEALDIYYPMLNQLAPLSVDICPASNYHFEKINSSPITTSIESELMFCVIENKRITHPSHFQDTRSIVFESLDSDSPLDFHPGDIASFYPQNIHEDVDAFLNLMGWSEQGDDIYQITSSKNRIIPAFLSRPKTLKEIIKTFIDLRGVPRRTFIEYLRYFSNDKLEKEKFAEWLASPEGYEEMFAYLQRPRRTLLEVLADFRSFQFPLDYLIDAFPWIRPRSFSIASTPGCSKLELLIGIVEYRTRLSSPRYGLATQFVKHCLVPDSAFIPKVHLKISSGTMRLPSSNETPIIMVGPGLGVAPFRSFVQQRIKSGSNNNYLIFGCRYQDKDQYYKEEWDLLQEFGQLWYKLASSRDQEKKVYVQDVIRENGEILWELIYLKQAYIYVCGSSGSMPKEVLEAFQDIMVANLPNQENR